MNLNPKPSNFVPFQPLVASAIPLRGGFLVPHSGFKLEEEPGSSEEGSISSQASAVSEEESLFLSEPSHVYITVNPRLHSVVEAMIFLQYISALRASRFENELVTIADSSMAEENAGDGVRAEFAVQAPVSGELLLNFIARFYSSMSLSYSRFFFYTL